MNDMQHLRSFSSFYLFCYLPPEAVGMSELEV